MDERWDGHYNLHYMITCFNADAAFYNCPDIDITPPGTAPVTNIDVLGSALCWPFGAWSISTTTNRETMAKYTTCSLCHTS